MIELQFSTLNSLTGRVVQIATWSWCSHVDFVLPNGLLFGAVPGQGVCLRPATARGRQERWVVDAPAEPILKLATSQIDKPYDWAGIFGWAFRSDWQKPDAWFCSELVAWAFDRAGYPLLRTEGLSRVTPRDLLMSPLLTKKVENPPSL